MRKPVIFFLALTMSYVSGCTGGQETLAEPLPYSVLHELPTKGWDVIDFENQRLYAAGALRQSHPRPSYDRRRAADAYDMNSVTMSEYTKKKGLESSQHFDPGGLEIISERWPKDDMTDGQINKHFGDYETTKARIMQSGKLLLTFSNVGIVYAWDTETGDLTGLLETNRKFNDDSDEAQNGGLTTFTTSPDGINIATIVGHKNGLQVWNAETLENSQTISVLDQGLSFSNATFSPDSRAIAAIQNDIAVGIWDVQTGQKIRTFGDRNRKLETYNPQLKFNDDGTLLMAEDYEHCSVWNVETGVLISQVEMYNTFRCNLNPEGSIVAAAGIIEFGTPNQIGLYDSKTGELLVKIPVNNTGADPENGFDRLNLLKFTPDGKFIVTSVGRWLVEIWSVNTGELFHAFSQDDRIGNVVFNPSGTQMATIGEKDTIIYDLTSID